MKKIFLDTETFSATPIRDGTYAYAADAEVMLVTYAYENDPVKSAAAGDIPQSRVALRHVYWCSHE